MRPKKGSKKGSQKTSSLPNSQEIPTMMEMPEVSEMDLESVQGRPVQHSELGQLDMTRLITAKLE